MPATTTTPTLKQAPSTLCGRCKQRDARTHSTRIHHLSLYLIERSRTDPQNLVVPFRPTEGVVPREVIQDVKPLPPFDRLPRILVPSPKLVVAKPPVMHGGWVVNEALLMQYAREHKLPIMRRSGPKSGYDPVTGKYIYDDISDEDPSNPLTADKFDPNSDRLSYFVLLRRVVMCFIEELNVQWPLDKITIILPFAAGVPLTISLFTNYDFAKAPAAASIEQLRVKLGEAESSKWFLDTHNWRWSQSPPCR